MVDELLDEFLNESREHLATIETDLLAIEEAGGNRDDQLVNKVFRAAHSIKGGSAFFGLTLIKDLAHKAETVLDMLRAGKMIPNAEITNVLLSAFDQLREMINNPAVRESADISELLLSLSELASSYLEPAEKPALTRSLSLLSIDGSVCVTLPQMDVERTRRSGQFLYCSDFDLIHDLERKGRTPLAVFRDIWETGEIIDCTFDFDAVGTLDGPINNNLPLRLIFATIIRPDDIGILMPDCAGGIRVLSDPEQPLKISPAKTGTPPAVVVSVPTVVATASSPEPVLTPVRLTPVSPAGGNGVALTPTPLTPLTPLTPVPAQPSLARPVTPKRSSAEGGAGAEGGGAHSPAPADTTLRVQVVLLEALMNLAGEMILSRNQLRDAIAKTDPRALAVADQRLRQVTSELQDAIMQTRLQPIGNVFSRFPRVVRDLSASLRKEVQLELRGHEVAMDKSLIEGLADPLTHMVRNSVDHGVETPDVRVAAGKNPQGTVRLEARHEAGQVVVEVADDGRGIDTRKIAQSAVAKGLVPAERVASMSEQELLQLIFLPGLSTAEKITEVSGRGVGMDVVKTNLDRIGGKVEIHSTLGRGTLFRIKLPLTLAIIPSLIVSVGLQRFAIPQVSVEELLHIRAEDFCKRLDIIGGAEVLMLREKIIPLVRFAQVLGDDAQSGTLDSGGLDIAIVSAGQLVYGLVVTAFHDTEEIVVKPLGRHLKGLREYAGATILGDGTVALILDVAGLAAMVQLASIAGREESRENTGDRRDGTQSLLLFHNAPDELCAVPLDIVLRIERIKPSQVETFGGRRTMQYRGAALPLVTLADAAAVKSIGDASDLAVIVSRVRGREVGLLGAMPVDVIDTEARIDVSTHRQRGVAGSVILNERTALVADLMELVGATSPDWFPACPESTRVALEPAQDGAGRSGTILLAEDSDFFRSQVKRFLEEDGRLVLEASDGESAWQLLLEHLGEIETVVTDVEMPRLSGLELARRIRADSRTSGIHVIGLSSLASEEDYERGRAAGFDDYQVKLDRDQLIAAVRGHASHAVAA